jgi:hypothetical protein
MNPGGTHQFSVEFAKELKEVFVRGWMDKMMIIS